MRRARIDLELRDLAARKPVAREHSLHRLADDLGRAPLELLGERPRAKAARIARVAVVALLLELVAGDRDLLGVDDDDEVTGVDVRRVLRLALSPQGVRDARGKATQGLAVGIDDVPALLDLLRLGGVSLHETENRRTGRPPSADSSSRQSAVVGAASTCRPKPRRAIQAAGTTTRTVAPIARAATPIAVNAYPPRSASVAPVMPDSRSLNPSSFPRSHGSEQSASWAVAATKERFQPRPSAKRASAVAGTLAIQRRLTVETAMSRRPPTSEGGRPILSTTSPTTRTSAYIPSTWAPMIGKTASPEWLWWSTTTAPVSVITPTMTPKLAWAARIDGITPRRLRISLNGAGGRGSASGVPTASASAMRFGSGRTKRTSASPTSMKHEPTSHRSARESPSRSRPESNGLKTAGPRIAPKTAPARTKAIPLALRSGGYMSPAAASARSDVPPAVPTKTRPRKTGKAESTAQPSAASTPPSPPRTKPVARTGTRPNRSIARPAGRAASAPEASTIAGPSPIRPLTPVTSTNVSEATAADSWSIPELAASEAERSAVLRLIGGCSGAADIEAKSTEADNADITH